MHGSAKMDFTCMAHGHAGECSSEVCHARGGDSDRERAAYAPCERAGVHGQRQGAHLFVPKQSSENERHGGVSRTLGSTRRSREDAV